MDRCRVRLHGRIRGVPAHRARLRRRSSGAVRFRLLLRRRSSLGSGWPAAGAPAAPRTARVVAVESLPDQPTHELPQRHVRIDVRKEALELLQPSLAVLIDHRLDLPAAPAQRPHPIRRHDQIGIHLCQHLHHLPRALPCSLIHQRLPRRDVQLRRRLPFRRWHQCRRRWRRAGAPHGCARPGPRAARRARPLPITPLEGGLQLRRRVQRQRAVPQPLARSLHVRAQLHGVDPPPRGGVAVAQPAGDVVEQAGEAPPQIIPSTLSPLRRHRPRPPVANLVVDSPTPA